MPPRPHLIRAIEDITPVLTQSEALTLQVTRAVTRALLQEVAQLIPQRREQLPRVRWDDQLHRNLLHSVQIRPRGSRIRLGRRLLRRRRPTRTPRRRRLG